MFLFKCLTLEYIFFYIYRHVGNTWACYVTLRLHMPTDNEKNRLRYVTLAPKTPTPKTKKILYVTQRRHMPTSILKNSERYATTSYAHVQFQKKNSFRYAMTSSEVKWRQITSNWRRIADDPINVLRRYVTDTAQMPTTPPKKILGYVTLALNMPMPTPCFLVLVTLRSESCPSVAYMTVFFFSITMYNWKELGHNRQS